MLLLIASGACDSHSTQSTGTTPSGPAATTRPALVYAGSAACADCHKDAHTEWHGSHHAQAQRPLRADLDRPAFEPRREIKHGSQTSTAELRDGRYVLRTLGPDRQVTAFEPVGVLAVSPLWQYLIPAPGGRLQPTELAFDPAKKEWFDVYGNEDRLPHEWGHWSNRGMNWNSMCAVCHTTAFEKNYDAATDSYKSTYQEMGVGCEACHGPLQAHVDWQRQHEKQSGDPTIRLATPWPDYFETCLACHSRRSDLTGRYRPGEKFSDHYEMVLPDLTDTFYPDGQVRDEDFEGAAFSMSYMHGQGIRCIDCHGAHTAAPNVRSNLLCLRCHENGIGTKRPINEEEHGHHPLGKPGSLCYECHMPQTAYMQRHLRRDHGMTVPDPLLTKEHGIPNACTRCHADKTVEWAIDTTNEWYGSRMERPTRNRATLLARLKKSDLTATPGVIELMAKEPNDAWRAVEARFLGAAIQEPAYRDAVVAALLKLCDDPSPLPQAAAIETLEIIMDPGVHTPSLDRVVSRVRQMFGNSSRAVRVKAAWALRHQKLWDLPGAAPEVRKAHSELLDMLTCNQDQPLGALRWAQYLVDTGHPEQSLAWYEKAIRWDPNAAAFRHSYAMTLDVLGKPKEAVIQAARAAELEPDQPMHLYALGLLYAELGQLQEARGALQSVVARDPRQARYWYNLALANSKLGQMGEAIGALEKAEDLEPTSADFPYVRGTLYFQAGLLEQARRAAERALQIDPQYAAARAMLQQIDAAGTK